MFLVLHLVEEVSVEGIKDEFITRGVCSPRQRSYIDGSGSWPNIYGIRTRTKLGGGRPTGRLEIQ